MFFQPSIREKTINNYSLERKNMITIVLELAGAGKIFNL